MNMLTARYGNLGLTESDDSDYLGFPMVGLRGPGDLKRARLSLKFVITGSCSIMPLAESEMFCLKTLSPSLAIIVVLPKHPCFSAVVILILIHQLHKVVNHGNLQ